MARTTRTHSKTTKMKGAMQKAVGWTGHGMGHLTGSNKLKEAGKRLEKRGEKKMK